MKEIEELKPDVIIACSMLWDIMRYGDTFLKKDYENNLDKFFTEVKKVVPETSAIIWANSPPVADRCYGGVFVKQVMNKKPFLKDWHLEAMKITQNLVEKHEVDMMDFLGYLYPYQTQLVKDGLHWSSAAHRYMTNIILKHVCDLWEAEGAKLAEKAVTKLEDYKDIYDDPDDAYLTDLQSLFDQQAVEAGHIPPPDPVGMGYDDGRFGPHEMGEYHRMHRMPPERGPPYLYDDPYYGRYQREDPMLRSHVPYENPYMEDYYAPRGPMPAAYDRRMMPYSRPPPRPLDYYGRADYYGYEDSYGGLPDSYLSPAYRIGGGYNNYMPRPFMSSHYPSDRYLPGYDRARYPAMTPRPYPEASFRQGPQVPAPSLAGQKRPLPAAETTGTPPLKKPAAHLESIQQLNPAAGATRLAPETTSLTTSTSGSYQKTFEERYGGPVGKAWFW